jgi:hypothetical protein
MEPYQKIAKAKSAFFSAAHGAKRTNPVEKPLSPAARIASEHDFFNSIDPFREFERR